MPETILVVDGTFASRDAALEALDECRTELREQGAVKAVLLDRATRIGEYDL